MKKGELENNKEKKKWEIEVDMWDDMFHKVKTNFSFLIQEQLRIETLVGVES